MKLYIMHIFTVMIISNIYAQTDTLIFKNGNMVIGENLNAIGNPYGEFIKNWLHRSAV
jgi:hypothetical protein